MRIHKTINESKSSSSATSVGVQTCNEGDPETMRKNTIDKVEEEPWELVAHHHSMNDGETNSLQQKVISSHLEKAELRNGPGRFKSIHQDQDGRTIDQARLAQLEQDFVKDPSGYVAQNAASSCSMYDLTLRRDLIQTSLSPYFSINLDHGGMPATDQKYSGRCWMFGTLNLFRFGTRDILKLGNFEFSESYLLFYHLLEQANFFLEFIIETVDRPLDDRLVSSFLGWPIDDGGDWSIAVTLINKYGLVPKQVYPESFSSSYTEEVDDFINNLLTKTAFVMRTMMHSGATVEEARQVKWKCVAQCHRVLTIHMGTPPSCSPSSDKDDKKTGFDWQWRDTDGTLHQLQNYSPHDFARNYVTVPYQDYISIIHDPRHEYYRRYQPKYAMPICGGDPVVFLNLPMCEIKHMSIAMMKDKLPVWFACNVDEEMDDYHGLWDENLYEMNAFYNIPPPSMKMTKADRIRYGSPMGTHVMLFTGVGLDVIGSEEQESKKTGASSCIKTLPKDMTSPTRWRVENSWGDSGDNGYYTMNNNWFDEYVFEVVAPPKYLSPKSMEGMQTSPIVLPGMCLFESS